MFRKSYLTLIVALTLLLVAMGPVYATPSLGLGSTASYSLTGKLQAIQSCTASPSTYSGQACSSTTLSPPTNVTLNGAGSTFVAPLLSAIDKSFTSNHPSVQVNYQPVGSGTGIADLSQKTVDFAASDAPLTNTQTVSVPNALTIPDTVGAVAVGYNLPGISTGLQLNVTVAAKIFQGNIVAWNDPAIQSLNPSLALPSNPITIVHRSDSSGTTFVFSGYLNSSSIWTLGQSKTILWPAASIGANGNQGVASVIQGTRYTIGYVELDYALSASPPITYSFLWNPTGNAYIQPSINSTLRAVAGVKTLPPGNGNWQSVSLLNSSNPGAYPIVSLSYIIVYQELNVYGSAMTAARALALVDYLSFVADGGQLQAAPLYYAPLPTNVVAVDTATINSITYNGQPPTSPQLPSPPVIAPTPTNVTIGLSGTVGWNIVGLSDSQSNLNVSHEIGFSVSPIPGISITPVTESGTFEQTINLSTRLESPSTATAMTRSFSTSILSGLAGATSALGVSGSVIQAMLSDQTNTPDYTTWWVNGPLSLGNPVQVSQGWSSVTASESLNLGSNIGTRSAWIVTSQLGQTVNLSLPNPNNPLSSTTSTASMNFGLLWSYDQSADLLLRNDNAASLTMHMITPTFIGTSTGPVAITVTRDTNVTIDIALLLLSTNLSLPKSSSHTSTLTDLLSAMPWIPLGLAGFAASIAVATIIWFTRKTKRATLPSSVPLS